MSFSTIPGWARTAGAHEWIVHGFPAESGGLLAHNETAEEDNVDKLPVVLILVLGAMVSEHQCFMVIVLPPSGKGCLTSAVGFN